MTPERGRRESERSLDDGGKMWFQITFEQIRESISIRLRKGPKWTTSFVLANEVCGGSRQARRPGPAAHYRPDVPGRKKKTQPTYANAGGLDVP